MIYKDYELMKRDEIYVFILVLLIGVGISCLLREVRGLPINLWNILIPNVVGLVSVWLYFRIKGNRKK